MMVAKEVAKAMCIIRSVEIFAAEEAKAAQAQQLSLLQSLTIPLRHRQHSPAIGTERLALCSSEPLFLPARTKPAKSCASKYSITWS